MKLIEEHTKVHGQIREDEQGKLWEWEHSNGKHVWANPVMEFQVKVFVPKVSIKGGVI